jgi:hypothetical protein
VHEPNTQALLTALASSGVSRDVVQAVETALPVLLERLSDNNSRLRDSARDALVALAQEPEGRAALRTQTALLCKPPRNQTAWRPVLAMLQLLQELVPLLGITGAAGGGGGGGRGDHNASGGGSGGGFELAELMAFVGAAFGSANVDVRAAALRVTVVAAEASGAAPVRRLLPQGMNPKMKEQVDAALGVEAVAPAAGEQNGGRDVLAGHVQDGWMCCGSCSVSELVHLLTALSCVLCVCLSSCDACNRQQDPQRRCALALSRQAGCVRAPQPPSGGAERRRRAAAAAAAAAAARPAAAAPAAAATAGAGKPGRGGSCALCCRAGGARAAVRPQPPCCRGELQQPGHPAQPEG